MHQVQIKSECQCFSMLPVLFYHFNMVADFCHFVMASLKVATMKGQTMTKKRAKTTK
jgi:hypothetical protein